MTYRQRMQNKLGVNVAFLNAVLFPPHSWSSLTHSPYFWFSAHLDLCALGITFCWEIDHLLDFALWSVRVLAKNDLSRGRGRRKRDKAVAGGGNKVSHSTYPGAKNHKMMTVEDCSLHSSHCDLRKQLSVLYPISIQASFIGVRYINVSNIYRNSSSAIPR